MSIPKVSIGMPVYNGEPFIREALDSLLSQTFADFELIISDNASTDATEAICREYASKDARIRYVRQPENIGAPLNFRFVLDEAVGEYFMWAAADDVWESNWIQTLLPVTETYRCLAYGMVVVIDERGKQMANPSSGRVFNYHGLKFVRRIKYMFAMGALGKANPIYGLIPRSTLNRGNFSIFDRVVYGSDMVFLFDLLRITEIRSPSENTRLYKRVWTKSIIQGKISGNGQFDSLLRKFFVVFLSWSGITYSSYCTPIESCVILLTIPLMFLRAGTFYASIFIYKTLGGVAPARDDV